MADRKEATRAHLRSLAEFYRNLAVGLFLTFAIGLLAQDAAAWLGRVADLWIIGVLGLMSLLYSQRLVERSYD